MNMKAANCSGKILKKLLVGLGAVSILLVLSASLFLHFYFQKTFSYQLTGVVIRCSETIQAKPAGGKWQPLRAGHRLTSGMKIQMPESRRSFVSFDGLRLLADGESQIEITGARSFSLLSGSLAVMAAHRDQPLGVSANATVLTTKESIFNVSAKDDSPDKGKKNPQKWGFPEFI